MLTIGIPAAVFATNCYILATGPGQECLIVDPGIGVEDRVAEVCRENGLRPAAQRPCPHTSTGTTGTG